VVVVGCHNVQSIIGPNVIVFALWSDEEQPTVVKHLFDFGIKL
jgi:hypothetical protein